MILVVVEHEAGAPDRLSSEALAIGAALAGATGSPLEVVAWGPGVAAIAGRLAMAGVTVLRTIAVGPPARGELHRGPARLALAGDPPALGRQPARGGGSRG